MAYKLEEYEPYIIEGKNGKEYKIPHFYDLGVNEFAIINKYNETSDAVEKIKVSKEFLLTLAPDLEKEGIGDVEYFNIFQDYIKVKLDKQKKKVGE